MTAPLAPCAALAQPRTHGKIVDARGVLVRVAGLSLHIGERVRIRSGAHSQLGEVVGLEGPLALVLPLQGLARLSGISQVESCGSAWREPDAMQLRGRIIDGLGEPLDDGPAPVSTDTPVHAPPSPLHRPSIDRAIVTGWRAIDGLLTCGEGQRMGIFAPAGAGKSTLLGSLAARVPCDTVVLGLIGERSREVADVLRGPLAQRGRSIIAVVATSERAPAERLCAAELATRLACQLRERGQHVLLLLDSLTRYARAGRDLGLALGEPAGSGGYPPSVQPRLARLVEAAGRGRHGSITAFYTLLCEHDDEPLAEEVRSLLDGHIRLSAGLAAAGHYPAIDILRSQSRLFEPLATPAQRRHATRFRRFLARYEELEWLLQVGEYQPGADAEADLAIAHRPAMLGFLRQAQDAPSATAQTCARLAEVFAGMADD